jgi:anaerobic magnesium-protoporphyrin IX monomethyl ester cyclase
MTDIILINPGAARTIYQNLSDDLSAIEPPTWLRMIAGWLRDRGHDIAIIDQDAMRWTPADVAVRVKELNPRLVAIVVAGQQPSASTQQMTGVRPLLESLRDRNTIIVGHHASALPERTLAEEPVTYVCDGEGPLTLAGLLDGDPPPTIPGLVWKDWRRNDSIRANVRAPLIPIDELHGDVWDLLPMDRYRAHTWQCMDGSPRQPYASIYTTLGCPFKCSFCMINVFQHSNQYRRRTPSIVVDQVERLYRDHGVRTLKFADEMFILDPKHYLPICEGLAQLPFADELNIWAYARVDTVKPDTLRLLRRAGIRWLALGIESGSAHVRDGAEKTLDDNDIKDTVKAIQSAGISVIGNFIFGLPDDTLESMRETLDLAKSLDLEFANFYSAMAYPGSALFDMANPKDLPERWSGYSQHSIDTTPLPTATLSSADVLRFRDEAFTEFFADPNFLESIERKFGPAATADIKAMTTQSLQRKLLEVK